MTGHDRIESKRSLAPRIAVGGLTAVVIAGLAVFLCRATRTSDAPSERGSRGGAAWSSNASLRALSNEDTRIGEIERIIAARQRGAVPILARLVLQEKDRDFRIACIRAMGAIGDGRAAQPLVGIAESQNENRDARVAAIAALGAIGKEAPLSLLSVILAKEEEPLRMAAIETVARRDTSEAIGMLANALKDPSKDIRAAAAAALAGKKSAEATGQLVRAAGSIDAQVRLIAVRELARREGPQVDAVLSKAASDPDDAVRAAAAQAAHRGGAAAIDAIIAGAGPHTTAAARLEIAKAIRRQADAKHAAALLRLLDDLDRRREEAPRIEALRKEVREGLLAMGQTALAPVLAAALDGECDAVTEQAAADACRQWGKPAAEAIVAGILKWKLFPDPEELKLWIGVLGDIGDPAALPALNRALAQDIAGISAVVETARAKIERQSGKPLPACVPNQGILFEKADLARAVPPAAPPAFHLPERADSNGLPADGVVRFVLGKAVQRVLGRQTAHGSHWASKQEAAEDDDSAAARPEQTGSLFDLEIEVRRRGGAWETDFIGYVPNYNKRNHVGRVVGHSKLPSGEVQLKIEMLVFDDQYVAGGYGEYELTFPPDRAQFEGLYRGHFNYEPRQGRHGGACWNVDWTKPDYPHFAPGEHPRLLCRKFQLDALREKARTDFGREVIRAIRKQLAAHKRMFQQRVEWVTTWTPGMQLAVGHGLLAHLFDDPEHGRRAAALVMERTTTVPYGGEHGERPTRSSALSATAACSRRQWVALATWPPAECTMSRG
ncbi:MAG: HEAT repeat domain-containing protein [Thermoguttaceae bacterium]